MRHAQRGGSVSVLLSLKRAYALISILAATAFLLALVPADANAAPSDDVFLTKELVPLKVVVRQASAIYTKAEKSGANKPAKMFNFYYVLKPGNGETGAKHNGFYYVSVTRSKLDAEGWIPEDDVVEWPHREALGLRANQGRDLAEFFASDQNLRDAYAEAPAQPPQAISREPKDYHGVQLLPILKTFPMQQNGDPTRGYEVAYMHATGAAQQEVGKPDLSRATLDVVFVIDTTASMGPFIDATKDVVTTIAKQLTQQKNAIPIRLGLVAYRDVIKNPPDNWYVDQLFCDLEQGRDFEFFRQVVDQKVKEASVGSEDIPEDVLAGLNCAITGTVDGKPARPGPGNSMKWNPDGFKCIILIGDASGQLENQLYPYKNKYKLNIETILKMAQPTGTENVRSRIIIHTARIMNPDQQEDFEICKQQFTQLAQGVDGLNMRGFNEVFDGKAGPHDDFVKSLVDTITKSQEALKNGIAGKPVDPTTPGLHAIMEFVGAGQEAGPGAAAPPFARGFACEVDRKGNTMFEPKVLVQHGDLETFISAVDFYVSTLRNGGEPGKIDTAQVLQNLTTLVTGLSIKEVVDANTPLSTVLKYTMGIPVKSKVFEMSIHKLANMPQADFEKWVSEVANSTKVVRQMLANDSEWFSLGDTEQPLQKRQGFIPVSDLP